MLINKLHKLIFASIANLTISCTSATSTFHEYEVLSCKELYAENLRKCTQNSTHQRASCFKSSEEDLSMCFSQINMQPCSIETTCKAECLFLVITCNEWATKTSTTFDCLNEQNICENNCRVSTCNM